MPWFTSLFYTNNSYDSFHNIICVYLILNISIHNLHKINMNHMDECMNRKMKGYTWPKNKYICPQVLKTLIVVLMKRNVTKFLNIEHFILILSKWSWNSEINVLKSTGPLHLNRNTLHAFIQWQLKASAIYLSYFPCKK